MMEEFLDRFRFRPELAGFIGVEREFFLVDPGTGMPVPRSPEFLQRVNGDKAWTYELSACQVEHRTSPCGCPDALRADLIRGVRTGRRIAAEMGLELRAMSVAPEDMPLDVYPDDRYLKIVAGLPEEVLQAACRVAGTHVHVGVEDIEDAVGVHDMLVYHLQALISRGDRSGGERLRIYRTMAPHCDPPTFWDVDGFVEAALGGGFIGNPRDCWHLVRISIHGTVEVRVFDASDDADEAVEWGQAVYTCSGKL